MAEEQIGRKIKKPFALTFREAILVKLDGGKFRLRFRRDGTPRQLREIARRLTGAPFVTLLDGAGKQFREFDYPIENTGAIECTIVAQHPVITVNALAALLWCEGNPMLEAMGNPMMGGDLIALGLRRLPPVRKVVAGAGYFVICLVDYSIRVIGDAPASHLEPRWKFSDLFATYEIPGATAFLWGDTYLQFWNRDKRKRPDGVISAGTCFATQSEDTQGGTGAIAWYTREGLEAEGLEAVGGSLFREHRSITRRKAVVGIQANQCAFCAILEDGDTLVWGDHETGGLWNGQIRGPCEVCAVQSTERAFAALTRQGSVIAWGDPLYGGSMEEATGELNDRVVAIQATASAFVAIKCTGEIVTWGCPASGGAIRLPLYSVVAVQATKYAFTSLHEGGPLHSWGERFWGGKLPTTYERLSGAKEVQSTHSAFAALFEDQTVRAWGSAKAGGDATGVQQELWGVQWIQANYVSFFALRVDLAVIVWGEATAIYEHKVPVITTVTEENYDDCLRRLYQLEDITDNTHRKEIEKWWSERV